LETEDIKELDKPAAMNMQWEDAESLLRSATSPEEKRAVQVVTLRQVLLELPFPLGSTGKKKKLFHSVDFAWSGQYAGLKVLATTYLDRVEVASSFLQILPAFVKEFYGEDAVKRWFHHQDEEIDAKFDYDDSETWLGTWTTSDDLVNQELLDEFIGIPFVLENLSILETDTRRRVLDAEEDSQRTFGMGGGATHASDNIAGSDDAASIASGASGGGGQQT
jgi:hypothetical protein